MKEREGPIKAEKTDRTISQKSWNPIFEPFMKTTEEGALETRKNILTNSALQKSSGKLISCKN